MYEEGLFHYSSYWRTWSRVIKVGDSIHEADLTPGCDSSSWNEIKSPHIRTHRTAPGKGDRFETELPYEIYHQMVANIGADLARFLVYAPLKDVAIWGEG